MWTAGDTSNTDPQGSAPPAAASTDQSTDAGASAEAMPRESFDELLERLDHATGPVTDHELSGAMRALAKQFEDAGEAVPEAVIAEEMAFTFMPAYPDQETGWGTYFGPMAVLPAGHGMMRVIPSVTNVTPEIAAYWRSRAETTPNPRLRARYADLLWDLTRKALSQRPDVAMARLAATAYLDAVAEGRFRYDSEPQEMVRRALDLAGMIGLADVVERGRGIAASLDERDAEAGARDAWTFSFDLLLAAPNKRFPVPADLENRIVRGLENRLSVLAADPPGKYMPSAAEAVALRLADYYRGEKQSAEAERVIRTYGAIAIAHAHNAAPMVGAHIAEHLHGVYLSYGLNDEADALQRLMRELGERALGEMKEVEVTVEVPREEAEAFIQSFIGEDARATLMHIAARFVPTRAAMETRVRERSTTSPLLSMLSKRQVNNDGRTIGVLQSVKEDPDGHVISEFGDDLRFNVPWLREVMSRASTAGLVSEDAVLKYLLASPLFEEERRVLLSTGLRAYFAGDAISAIHILVPQIERAVWRLAALSGAPVQVPNRIGGFNTRMLGDLLSDDTVVNVLTADVATYLRVLLTDARGWNLRNDVCHGLAPVSAFQAPAADRVLHALLVLGLIASSTDAAVGLDERRTEPQSEELAAPDEKDEGK